MKKLVKVFVALAAVVVLAVGCTKMEADSTKNTGIVNPHKVIK